jgi:protein TonB
MFNRLPESNAQRQKRGGGFFVSTAVHVVVIALAVRATALTATQPAPATVEPIYIAPQPEAPPAPRARTPSTTLPTAAPAVPTVDIPVVVPTDIPTTIPDAGSMSRLLDGAFDGAAVSNLGGIADGATPNVAGGQPLEERHVDRPVVPVPGTASPRYPSLLQSAGVEGDVRAQFVVDTLGRVETGSVKILDSSHGSFAQAVRDALARARFVPAEAGGRKVRQLVEQPFSFKLTGR